MNRDLEKVHHLAESPWRCTWSSKIDRTPVLGWVLGSVGMLWLPLVVGITVSVLLYCQVESPTLCWSVTALIVLQCLSGFIAHWSRQHREFEVGRESIRSLLHFLDFMHAQIFSKNTSSRITIMVPKDDPGGRVLRTFLRPTEFLPLDSDTELAISCNTGRIEGAAGQCYCDGSPQVVTIAADPSVDIDGYAQQSGMPVEKARKLTRKSRYYLAVPIENLTGPHLGVLVVDNVARASILDTEVAKHSERAEQQTRMLVKWVSMLMKKIPRRLLEQS